MEHEQEARNKVAQAWGGVGFDIAQQAATGSDDGAGELEPPTVRTAHSSGCALWAMRVAGICRRLPASTSSSSWPSFNSGGFLSVVCTSNGRCWQITAGAFSRPRTQVRTQVGRSAVLSQNR